MIEYFQRYTAPDPDAHAQEVERLSAALSNTSDSGSLTAVDLSTDLASLLTTSRREAQARELLVPLQSTIHNHLSSEPAGWYYLSFGTASQYLGLRAEANAMFAQALRLARSHRWERLEHFVLVHWGRSLVEEREFCRAREYFVSALGIRERLKDPSASRVRRLLDALDALESRTA